MNAKKIFGLIALILVLIPSLVFATTFKGGDEIFVIETINDDVYLASGLIQLNADVNGDLTAGGGRISIESKVSQDLNLVGGDIVVRAEVGDDARLLGGTILIDSIIKDDLLVGGGSIELTPDSFVGGDFTFGAGNVVLGGVVNGNVFGGAGNIYINNEIKGNVTLYNVDKLQFGPSGKILGNLTYKSDKASESVTGETVLGEIKFKRVDPIITEEDARSFFWKAVAGFSVFKLLSTLFVGLFFIWILRFYMVRSVEIAYKKSLKSFGFGILVLLVTPILFVLFLVSGIGIPLAFLLALMWFLLLFVGKLVAIMMIGMKLIKINDKSSFLRVYSAFALGAFLFIILTLIPVIGWLFKLILVLIGIGGLVIYELEVFHLARKKKLV